MASMTTSLPCPTSPLFLYGPRIMKNSPLSYLIVVAILVALPSTAMAQQGTIGGGTTGGTTTGTGTGQTATGTGTNTGTGTGTGQPTAGLNAEEAFAGIERGDSIGSTAGTGQGFGVGATANPRASTSLGGGGFGGLGGLGGFGGLNSLFGGGGAGGQSAQPAIRTRLRSAIKVDPVPPQRVQQSAMSRLRACRPQVESTG